MLRWEDGLFVFPMEVGDDGLGTQLVLAWDAIGHFISRHFRLGLLSAFAEWQWKSQLLPTEETSKPEEQWKENPEIQASMREWKDENMKPRTCKEILHTSLNNEENLAQIHRNERQGNSQNIGRMQKSTKTHKETRKKQTLLRKSKRCSNHQKSKKKERFWTKNVRTINCKKNARTKIQNTGHKKNNMVQPGIFFGCWLGVGCSVWYLHLKW